LDAFIILSLFNLSKVVYKTKFNAVQKVKIICKYNNLICENPLIFMRFCPVEALLYDEENKIEYSHSTRAGALAGQ
jgi:hypothetical protein